VIPDNKFETATAEHPLTPDEVKALIRGCSKRAPTRQSAIGALIVLLYRSALRISEGALSLRAEIRIRRPSEPLHYPRVARHVLKCSRGGPLCRGLGHRCNGGWIVEPLSRHPGVRRVLHAQVEAVQIGLRVGTLLPRPGTSWPDRQRVHAHGLRHAR